MHSLRSSIYTAAAALILSVCLSAAAEAQLTTAGLIGQVVADPAAAKYNDLGEAITKFRSGDADAARKLVDSVTKANPELPPAGILMAQMFLAANLGQQVRLELEQLAAKQPTEPEPYLVFADQAFMNGSTTDAAVLFEKAAGLAEKYAANPKRKKNLQWRAAAGLAAVAERREQWAEAEKHLTAWTTIDPDSNAAMNRLGQSMFLQGGDAKEKAAYAVFQDMYKKDETQPRAEISMAMLYEQQASKGAKEKHSNAKKLMQLAAERDPTKLATRLQIAQWAINTCELDMAKENADAALKIDAKSLEAKLFAGSVARQMGDMKAAETQLQSAVTQSPGNFLALNQLALVLIESPLEDRRKLALEYAQINARSYPILSLPGGQLQAPPQSRESTMTHAWVHFKLGRDFEAERLVQTAFNIQGSSNISSEAAYFAAKILSSRGKKEAPVQILEPALKASECFAGAADAKALLEKLKKGTAK